RPAQRLQPALAGTDLSPRRWHDARTMVHDRAPERRAARPVDLWRGLYRFRRCNEMGLSAHVPVRPVLPPCIRRIATRHLEPVASLPLTGRGALSDAAQARPPSRTASSLARCRESPWRCARPLGLSSVRAPWPTPAVPPAAVAKPSDSINN